MDKEDQKLLFAKFKVLSESLTTLQIKSIDKMMEKVDKRIERKLSDASKRLSERTIAEIKERLEMVNNIEQVTESIKELKRITEELVDRHTVLTEVSFIARQRLDVEGQAKVNAELIRSMDFGSDWFKRRNDMSLNNLFEMYKNGVEPDVAEE